MMIREPTLADHSQWLSLWNDYNAFYGREGRTALSPEITDATWHRFFDPDEPVHALVADQDGQLVGLAHFLFHRSTISVSPTCYLQDLFTSEAARGAGVATALVERVSKEARAGKALSVSIGRRTRRIFAREGFTIGSPNDRVSSSTVRCWNRPSPNSRRRRDQPIIITPFAWGRVTGNRQVPCRVSGGALGSHLPTPNRTPCL